MRRFPFTFAAALLCAGLASPAGAQPPAKVDLQACRSEGRALCGQVAPGGGRLLACLKGHEPRLSDACRAALPTLERCAAKLQPACGHVSGTLALGSCLREHIDKLSPECRAGAAGLR